MLADIVGNVAGEVTKTKQLCYQSVHDCVQVTLYLFPVYIHHPGKVRLIVLPFLFEKGSSFRHVLIPVLV